MRAQSGVYHGSIAFNGSLHIEGALTSALHEDREGLLYSSDRDSKGGNRLSHETHRPDTFGFVLSYHRMGSSILPSATLPPQAPDLPLQRQREMGRRDH
eukprot:c41062_g1_i1 orf=57-353(+)